jgi:hypothetical protein
MKRVYLTAAALLVAATAAAEPAVQRVRGSVTTVADNVFSIHPADGADQQISTTADTKYLRVVKSSLDKVEPGSYIGTATKTVGSNLVALEVLIFPPDMKGTGEGHYDWDNIPDTTRSGGGSTHSSMTNGNVAAVAAGKSPSVKSSMTNGNVASVAAQNGTKQLTVTYNGGEQTITVPPTAPIVTFQPGMKSDLATGASAFVLVATDGKSAAPSVAQLVAIGVDGVKPPM